MTNKIIQGVLIASDKKDFPMWDGSPCPVYMVSKEVFKELRDCHRDFGGLSNINFDESQQIYTRVYMGKNGGTTMMYYKQK